MKRLLWAILMVLVMAGVGWGQHFIPPGGGGGLIVDPLITTSATPLAVVPGHHITITAQATDLQLAASVSTPQHGARCLLWLTADSSNHNLDTTTATVFVNGSSILPTGLVASKRTSILLVYNGPTSTWKCEAAGQE